MTRDELLTLVREAGMWASSGEFLDSRQGKFIERLAQLAAEKEREKMLDELRLLADAKGNVKLWEVE